MWISPPCARLGDRDARPAHGVYRMCIAGRCAWLPGRGAPNLALTGPRLALPPPLARVSKQRSAALKPPPAAAARLHGAPHDGTLLGYVPIARPRGRAAVSGGLRRRRWHHSSRTRNNAAPPNPPRRSPRESGHNGAPHTGEVARSVHLEGSPLAAPKDPPEHQYLAATTPHLLTCDPPSTTPQNPD